MFYINCFLLYSILGYLLETLAAFITKSNFKSGILFGPWTPVYGLGAVLIILISRYFLLIYICHDGKRLLLYLS